ncbi:hypothetical protein, partial [Peribacillus frigoritolerans]|uniref:hypothetical protein n=1 Tax=Peribacillus frigoritolerans TaxID=450367 RepID=UPI003F4F8E6A
FAYSFYMACTICMGFPLQILAFRGRSGSLLGLRLRGLPRRAFPAESRTLLSNQLCYNFYIEIIPDELKVLAWELHLMKDMFSEPLLSTN